MSDVFHSGAAREGDPDTSVAAAASVNATYLEGLVAAQAALHPEGITWDEAAEYIGIPRASVSPRFKPLRQQGRLTYLRDAAGKIVTRLGKSTRRQRVHVVGSGASEDRSKKFTAVTLEAAVRDWLTCHTQPDIEQMCKDIIQ